MIIIIILENPEMNPNDHNNGMCLAQGCYSFACFSHERACVCARVCVTNSSLCIGDVVLRKALRPVRRREGDGVRQLRGEVLRQMMERGLYRPLQANGLHLLLLQVCMAREADTKFQRGPEAPDEDVTAEPCERNERRTIADLQDGRAGNCAEGVERHTLEQAGIFREGLRYHQGAQLLCGKQDQSECKI